MLVRLFGESETKQAMMSWFDKEAKQIRVHVV
jgi:hypothetical protein